MLKSAVDLFEGKALIWYRAVKSSLVDWDCFVDSIRAEFEPIDYDEKLLDEIRRRTQGKDEPIGIYLVTMKSLFERCKSPPPEERQLRIILRNIQPFFQAQLALVEVKSYVELRKLCRQLEERRESVEAFQPPVRKSQGCLEPDLAYTGIEEGVSEVQIRDCDSKEQSNSSSRKVSFNSSKVVCFNCNMPGHKSIGCAAPKQRRCFKCNNPGYTVKTCPKCSFSGNGSSR